MGRDTDRNFKSYADVTGVRVTGERYCPKNAGQFDDILKLSNCDDFRFESVLASQGSENALDMNRDCVGGFINGDFGVGFSGGYKIHCAIVVKGGAKRIVITGVIHSRGPHYDVEVGGWSDQVLAKSEDIDLSGLKHADGKPVMVAVAHAKRVRLGRNCKRTWLWSTLLLIHRVGKLIQRKFSK